MLYEAKEVAQLVWIRTVMGSVYKGQQVFALFHLVNPCCYALIGQQHELLY